VYKYEHSAAFSSLQASGKEYFAAIIIYRVFQKELYNFGSVYEFIQRACAVFGTVIM
jgi:hypothetical protein